MHSITLSDVTKSHGARLLLDRVSLVVGEGSRIGVVGPNGVGKTTLLRLLAEDRRRRRGYGDGRARGATRRGARARGALHGGARPVPRAGRFGSRRSCGRRVRRGRARRPAGEATRVALGRAGSAGAARGAPPGPVRRLLPRRADERPRLRGP
ncbi:MAG: ATP-binding cassette domain-containing protein, partial [Actinobacteria bacterium]